MTVEQLYKYIIPDTSGIALAPKIRTQEEITPESVRQAMNQWRQYELRFRTLYYAYVGRSPTSMYGYFEMSQEDDSEDHVLSNFCGYIVKSLKGYIAGNPPEYDCEEGDVYAERIFELFKEQNKQQVDADILQDMSTYGRGFELVYRADDEMGTPKSVVVNPRNAFVAYAGDVEEDSIFGGVLYTIPKDDDSVTYRLFMYTRTDVIVWESNNENGPWDIVEGPTPHGFGRVPLIEYANNKEYMGDFEPIIALQNVYNRTLINRVADKDAFVKSILMVMGQVLGKSPEEVQASLDNLKKNRVLQMDTDASAAYLEKSLDETGVQVLQDQIKNDIHKFSFVPDLSDEQFANNASGVAMAYKLFGTDQLVAEKALNFQKGFTRRCKLYDAALNNTTGSPDYEPKSNIGAMNIKFKFNTPQDLSYMSTALTQLVTAGILSKDGARRALSIITDADVEAEKVDNEADAQAERNRAAFEDDYSTTPQNMGGNPALNQSRDDSSDDDEEDNA